MSGVMLEMSLPASKGAEKRAHILKCARYSSLVIPPLPTSSMSGSYPMARACVTLEAIHQVEDLGDTISAPGLLTVPAVLDVLLLRAHRLPTGPAHSQGFVEPHSQILKTIGRPAAASALRMSV